MKKQHADPRVNQIRSRLSFKRYSKLAEEFDKIGLSKIQISQALSKVHELMSSYKAYRSRAADEWAGESIGEIKTDLEKMAEQDENYFWNQHFNKLERELVMNEELESSKY